MPWRANKASAASNRRLRCSGPRAEPEGLPGRRAGAGAGAGADADADADAAFADSPPTAADAVGFESFRTFTAAVLRGARFTSCSFDGDLAIAFNLTCEAMSHILIPELINFNAVVP
jgi:hypothetical protein